MTPADAKGLLAYFADYPARVKRYEMEGGNRQAWKCPQCGCMTEAKTKPEAVRKLTGWTSEGHGARWEWCDHKNINPTGQLMPPHDFS